MPGLDPITAVANFASGIIDKIFPDKTEAEKAKAALAQLDMANEANLLLGQLQINVEEAKSQSIFVAGWRPFIGWVCGAGFAWQYALGPFLTWLLGALGHPTALPAMDASELMTILLGMLGLAGMRSYDKKSVLKNGK